MSFYILEKKTYPTEEEQFAAYRQVAEMMAGKEVIIRTLDIGADKQADYFKLKKEENPAMGYRAIRICLTRPEIFTHPASGDLPRQRIRKDFHHVPDDRVPYGKYGRRRRSRHLSVMS